MLPSFCFFFFFLGILITSSFFLLSTSWSLSYYLFDLVDRRGSINAISNIISAFFAHHQYKPFLMSSGRGGLSGTQRHWCREKGNSLYSKTCVLLVISISQDSLHQISICLLFRSTQRWIGIKLQEFSLANYSSSSIWNTSLGNSNI